MADAPNPKGLTIAQEDAALDQVSRETLLWTRRAFFATALLGGASLLLMMPDVAEKVEERNRKQRDAFEGEDELRRLLTSYLYPSNPGDDLQARVPLVPAMQDPWGPPKRQFSGSGNAVAAAYVSAFTTQKDKHIVQGAIDVQDDDAPVLIASHLVSEQAARYFGNPKSVRPIHEVHVHDGRDRARGFKANIRWAIYTPETAKVVRRRELFQGTSVIREEPVHSLADLDNPKLQQPQFAREGDLDYQLDDYLLISVLPRDSRMDRRMVSLAGLHKPGTLAAEQLLSDPNQALGILKKIHEKVEGLPYYQALIATKVDHSSGLPRPTQLELRGVQPIKGITRF